MKISEHIRFGQIKNRNFYFLKKLRISTFTQQNHALWSSFQWESMGKVENPAQQSDAGQKKVVFWSVLRKNRSELA